MQPYNPFMVLPREYDANVLKLDIKTNWLDAGPDWWRTRRELCDYQINQLRSFNREEDRSPEDKKLEDEWHALLRWTSIGESISEHRNDPYMASDPEVPQFKQLGDEILPGVNDYGQTYVWKNGMWTWVFAKANVENYGMWYRIMRSYDVQFASSIVYYASDTLGSGNIHKVSAGRIMIAACFCLVKCEYDSLRRLEDDMVWDDINELTVEIARSAQLMTDVAALADREEQYLQRTWSRINLTWRGVWAVPAGQGGLGYLSFPMNRWLRFVKRTFFPDTHVNLMLSQGVVEDADVAMKLAYSCAKDAVQYGIAPITSTAAADTLLDGYPVDMRSAIASKISDLFG